MRTSLRRREGMVPRALACSRPGRLPCRVPAHCHRQRLDSARVTQGDAYLRVVPDEAGLCGEIARYNRLVKFVVVVEGCASACGARTF